MPSFKPEENFVREFKFESDKKPSSFYKTVTLHVLSVISAFFFGLAYFRYLNSGTRIWVVLALLAIYLIFSSLSVIFIKNLRIRSVIIGLEVLAPVVFFIKTPAEIIVTVILALAFFGTLGEITARKKMANSISPSYLKITRSKTTRLVTAISLMVILLYAPRLDQNGEIISQGAFDHFFQQVIGVAGKINPSLNLTQSVNDFAKSLANQSLVKDENFQELDEKNKEISIFQSGAKIIADIESSLKVKINPSEKLSDAAYAVASNKLGSLHETLQDQFRFGWLIILFVIIRSFGFIVTLIISAVVSVLVNLMISLNFAHATGESCTKESVKF